MLELEKEEDDAGACGHPSTARWPLPSPLPPPPASRYRRPAAASAVPPASTARRYRRTCYYCRVTQSDKIRSDIDMGDRYGRSIWDIGRQWDIPI